MSKPHLFICPVLGSNEQMKLSFVSFVVAMFSICLSGRAAEEKSEVLYTSPSGAFRAVQVEVTPSGNDESGQEFWIISTRDKTRRTKPYSSEITFPTVFYSAPGELWLFVESHQGSCLQRGDLYRRKDDDAFEVVPSFSDRAWKDAVKLAAFKNNYSAEGVCAMIQFGCWSFDASRLLILMLGGDDRGSTKDRYIYFNTRTNNFELTDYLRKLNKTKVDFLACAEPLDSLPSETELKTRYEELDRKLNKRYAEVIAKRARTVERPQQLRSATTIFPSVCTLTP
jgi:hypothetical protein